MRYADGTALTFNLGGDVRTYAIGIVACLLMLALPCSSHGNPVPGEYPGLREELQSVISRGERGHCATLIELLGRRGTYILTPGTLSLLAQNMTLLEPCVIASQRTPDVLNADLHIAFRRTASPNAVSEMRSVLAGRVTIPSAVRAFQKDDVSVPLVVQNRAHRAIQELLDVVEVLGDYRASQDTGLIAAVYDSLRRLPADSLLVQGEFHSRPSWLIHMALVRYERPEGGAVFFEDEQGRRFLRADSTIAAVDIRSHPPHGLLAQPVTLSPATVADIFERLASDSTASPDMPSMRGAATLGIHYRDGVSAAATGYSQGWVVYHDNTRLLRSSFAVSDPELAAEIIGFTTLVKRQEAAGGH
jgi:hypothetical protein